MQVHDQNDTTRLYTLVELKDLGYGSVDTLRRKVKRTRPGLKLVNGKYRLRFAEIEAILEEDKRRRSELSKEPWAKLKLEAKRVGAAAPAPNADQRALIKSILEVQEELISPIRGGASR